MQQEQERELLLEQLEAWIASKEMDQACRSSEVMALIRELEREHHAYPQTVVNVREN